MRESDVRNAVLLGVQRPVHTPSLQAIHFDAVVIRCSHQEVPGSVEVQAVDTSIVLLRESQICW